MNKTEWQKNLDKYLYYGIFNHIALVISIANMWQYNIT